MKKYTSYSRSSNKKLLEGEWAFDQLLKDLEKGFPLRESWLVSSLDG